MTEPIEGLLKEARKAMRCLYIVVDESVAKHVEQRCEAAFTALRATGGVPEPMSDVIKACQVLAVYHEMMIEHLTKNPSAELATDTGIAMHKDAVELMRYFEAKEKHELAASPDAAKGAGQWKDISTLPTGDHDILIYWKGSGIEMVAADSARDMMEYKNAFAYPTHWMPLPPPPAGEK